MAILTDLPDLLEDTRDIILETTEGFWTDDYIERQLEKAHQIASAKVKLVKMIWTVTLQTDADPEAGYAQIVDDREILLPSTFISIDEGGVYYNDDVVKSTSLKEIKDNNKNWLDAEGTPHRYYLRGDMLGFDKQISAGDTVRIYGIKMPDALSDTQAPFDEDYRTTGYRYLLVEYAVGMCLKMKKDKEWLFYLQPKVGSFWVGLQEMRFELMDDNDEDYGLIPADNLARPHGYGLTRWPDWSQF